MKKISVLKKIKADMALIKQEQDAVFKTLENQEKHLIMKNIKVKNLKVQ